VTPLPAAAALDAYFLEARSRLLDVAAILDRIDRGSSPVTGDSRLEKIRRALAVLAEPADGRAERIQTIFSLPYEDGWPIPKPK
jgi:hypothetical protein